MVKAKDFDVSGRWDITTKDTSTDKVTTDTYDAVMVCIGQHSYKYTPDFDGIESFRGKVCHSNDYRSSRGYEDKKVVVLGVGNSGVDTAVDVCRVSKQVSSIILGYTFISILLSRLISHSFFCHKLIW